MNAPSKRNLPRRDNHWLAGILGLSNTALISIREEVAGMAEQYALKHKGKSRREVSHAVSSKLIRREAIKAGGFGGLTATPSLLPGVGTLTAAIAGATVDLAYLTKIHVDLCYRISAAYQVEMDADRLKAVALALLGFSGSAEVTKQVAATTLRSMVDKAAGGYLRRGLADVALELAEKVSPKVLGFSYKLIPFLGVPLNASINAASTVIIGKQARKYFSTWDDDLDSML